MKNYPRVSVITITYGQKEYILETIKSIISQEYLGEIEYIIANDNSPDGTDEIINKYFSETKIPENFTIKYTCHPVNKGAMKNVLWAFNEATGKYIALCEGDDFWIDTLKLQKQVEFMEANPEYSFCFHSINIMDDPSDNEMEIYPPALKKSTFEQEDIAVANFIPTPSMLFRRHNGNYPILGKTNIGDYPLQLFLSSLGKAKYLNFVGATYRRGVGIYSTLEKVKQQVQTKLMLEDVSKADFISAESRKLLNKQKQYYGTVIFSTNKGFKKYFNLFIFESEFSNFTFSEKLKILGRSLIYNKSK